MSERAFGKPQLPYTFYNQEDLSEKPTNRKSVVDTEYPKAEVRRVESANIDANLLSSLLDGQEWKKPLDEEARDEDYQQSLHGIAIDVDLPVSVVETSPGRHHLYIDKKLNWYEYKQLLYALAMTGVIEWGYYYASVHRGATFLRRSHYDEFLESDEQRIRQVAEATRKVLEDMSLEQGQ
jgi:hypothetical protein